MTEVAVDSAVSSEQPSGAQPSESVSEMGMGFIEADASPLDSEGSGAEQPAAGEGSVDAAPTTTNTEAPTPPTRLAPCVRRTIPARRRSWLRSGARSQPEEARGLTVVDQLVQERAQQIAAAEISKGLDPYRAYLDRLEPAMGMVNRVA